MMDLPSPPKPVFSSNPTPMPSHSSSPRTPTPISRTSSSTTLTPASTLPSPKPPTSILHRLKSHLTQLLPPTATSTTTLLLLLLTICTGIQDATTFPDYHCFASNQTGNTIFLTLAVILPSLNGKMFVTSNIAVALCCFLLGAFATGQAGHWLSRLQLSRHTHRVGRKDSHSTRLPSKESTKITTTSGPRTRYFLLLTNALQTLLVFLAALLQHLYPPHLTSTSDLIVIGLLAFASGSQVVQSRSFKCTEISTAMATAAWVDLVVDEDLFGFSGWMWRKPQPEVRERETKRRTRGRDRRVMFIVALVMGGFLGAVLYRFGGSKVAIAVSGVGKGAVVVGFWFHEGEDGDEEEEGGV